MGVVDEEAVILINVDDHLNYAVPQPVENSGLTIDEARAIIDRGHEYLDTHHEQSGEAAMKTLPAHPDSEHMYSS